jgi:hypothetical protein
MKKQSTGFAAKSVVSSSKCPIERASYASQMCVILTEKCNIRCRHCINNCSPSGGENLDMGILESFIRQAAESIFVSSIGFSGGEPFIDIERMEQAVGLCREYGLDCTVSTNGFWASSVAAAKNILGRLKGLSRLCVSTDVFHQEFIPSAIIINAINACNELDIDCCILVTYLNDPGQEVETVRQNLRDAKGSYEIQQWPVLRIGRALSEIDHDAFFIIDLSNAVCVSADSPTLNVSGELIACCGPASQWPQGHRLSLKYTSKQSLKETLQAADQDPVIHALRVWGPTQLLRLAISSARQKGFSFAAPEVVDMCSICERLCTDPFHTDLVQQALDTYQTQRELAVARMIQLGEVSMFHHLTHGKETA